MKLIKKIAGVLLCILGIHDVEEYADGWRYRCKRGCWHDHSNCR